MGGKTKQSQRTKNNSRPSNSGRSAELLGSTIPSFVGFTAHSDLGFIPLAPGFSTSESLPETFDANISSQCQLILRKMSKKDPVTRVKALQEFTELVQQSDAEFMKVILPLWPRFYHNLANDVEHRVREAAQQSQSALVQKSGKLLAPYLKQLAPVWISSQFDNYAPVASIATSSFNTAFAAKKFQEVLIFCQNEIFDYIMRNLTFHTATTLSNVHSCTPEEAENKYQRILVCSLKLLALYLEKTEGNLQENEEMNGKLSSLLQHQKFWSFAKYNKATSVKSAWFEGLYSLLQYAKATIENHKQQVIALVFQNMDETDPLIAPHVWGCILTVQIIFPDWFTHVSYKKVIQPKLVSILKNGANSVSDAIFPHLLPFISKFSDDTVQNYPLKNFYIDFFNVMKISLTNTSADASTASKSVVTSFVTTYFECLRYAIQQIKSNENDEATNFTSDREFCLDLLKEHIIDVIKWILLNKSIAEKSVFTQVSTLIGYWSQNSNSSKLYSILSIEFWEQIGKLLIENQDFLSDEENLKRVVEFMKTLHHSSPSNQDCKVKFSDETSDNEKVEKIHTITPQLQGEFYSMCIQLGSFLMERSLKDIKSSKKYICELKTLAEIINDVEFYCKITKTSRKIDSLEIFMKLLIPECDQSSAENVIDIIFEVLTEVDKDQRLNYLNRLLQTSNSNIHQLILQRLLSYPLCIEPEVREILSQQHVSKMILDICRDVISTNCKEKLNLLHKCFFQIDSGELLINSETAEGIVEIMSEPLVKCKSAIEITENCSSFIAQVMPVICSNHTSKELQRKIFLILFQFSIEMVEDYDLSEDTLWEITTCWQDALSSNDIKLDDNLIQSCSEIINTYLLRTEDLTLAEINNISDVTGKLILCSTENHNSSTATEDEQKDVLEKEKIAKIDSLVNALLDAKSASFVEMYEYTKDISLYFESIHGLITLSSLKHEIYEEQTKTTHHLRIFFRKQLFFISTILKLICNVKSTKSDSVEEGTEGEEKPVEEDEQEYTEDYYDANEHLLKVWTETIYTHILQAISVAAMGESLMNNSHFISDDLEFILLVLLEKCILILKNSPESYICKLKNDLLEKMSSNIVDKFYYPRALLYLTFINEYEREDENGPIILYEDLSSYFLEKGCFMSYVNMIQVMMSKLGSKNLPINPEILMENKDLLIRTTALRSFIENHFTDNFNELSDKKLINECSNLIESYTIMQKTSTNNNSLLFNTSIKDVELEKIIFVTEYMNLLSVAVEKMSSELTLNNWDSIRVALSSWILTISKNIKEYKNLKVAIFIARGYNFFKAFSQFVEEGKTKSSTSLLSNVIDEWENVFAKETNLVLFRSYRSLIDSIGEAKAPKLGTGLLDVISPCMESINYSFIFEASKTKISSDELINFMLENLSNSTHSVKMACVYGLRELSKHYISNDMISLEKYLSEMDKSGENNVKREWHLLHKFSPFITKYENIISKYLDDLSYKVTEITRIADLEPVNSNEALPYLLVWDCIIYICGKSPAELRSFYARWIRDNHYEQTFLHFLFRAMPIEILRHYHSTMMSNDMFKSLKWTQFKETGNLSTGRLACYLYTQTLRYLPAVVRKWWNMTKSRQKYFVDKLTTNFVSNLICQEELKGIADKEKHENMKITVHTSTREVVAVYSIEDARMELVITLAPNHPLGAVKVEIGKQIGGRALSRNVAMQLTIFLTHQNGSIFDGLSIWKNNLDNKFEGVEECYVCYTVIHQDTFQLPRLSCRTCKKKFHGPCLYKWFTTSSKSTCPICRNVF